MIQDTDKQKQLIECVYIATSLPIHVIRDELIAEEWDVKNAIYNLIHAFPDHAKIQEGWYK